jgi:hypothetical protein
VTSPGSNAFDLDRIVEALAVHDVIYVVIGGTSGLLHGVVEHVTRDVDVLIRSDLENRDRLARALTDLGAVSDHPINAQDFAGNTQWETDAGAVDVLVTATGPAETIFVYADIEPEALIIEIASGRLVPIASLDDIIRMKEAANRQKDLDALPELRRLRGDSHPERTTIVDPFAFDIEYGADD